MFEMLNSIRKTVSNLAFMVDVTVMLSCECVKYFIKRDYRGFIQNVAKNLAQKNILYVKMFQAISLNNNLIDDTMNSELLKYTDSAPYTEDDIDIDLFEAMINIYTLVPCNDTIPMKSGMISIVYKLRDVNGGDVILKMKRKNIDAKLEDAIEKLLFFIEAISLIPQFNVLDIPSVIKKNIALLRQQLDFQEEVKNTLEMAENCKNLKYIKIPKVYKEVTESYPNIIMMEYINGVHISKLDDTDYNEYAKLVMKYGFVSIINNSVTHGDLHAGNIIFIKNAEDPVYQLGLIDFGIVTRINEKTTKVCLESAVGLFSKSGKELAQLILDNIIEPQEVFKSIQVEHRENLYVEAGKILDDVVHKAKDASQVKMYDFIKKFNEYLNGNNLREHGLHVSDDFVKFQMALAMSQGVSLCLCKNDYMPFANKVLNELFHTDLIFEDSE
uniref:ABC1 atypical kinase-like domain-containing protein n=1 Tax=viral metagenome TaxID=1070528 RepID=A0A6C0HPZ7_9ZZZZ